MWQMGWDLKELEGGCNCSVRSFPSSLRRAGISDCRRVYTGLVAKHLIDVDEPALGAARAELGTTTIRDTVNEALRRAAFGRQANVAKALDVLSSAQYEDREDAWR